MMPWLAVILTLLAFTLFFLILFLLPGDAYGEDDVRVFSEDRIKARNRTAILVLGDIGRSPRMQNHALSVAKFQVEVDLIGYLDSELHPRIKAQKHLHVHVIGKTPKLLQGGGKSAFVVMGPLKVLWQFWELWMILGHRTKPAKWLIVQNPPSIPTLMVASMICWCRKTKLVVDWHNFGYSILALKLGNDHPMVKTSYYYERYFSGAADVNFTVSDAMTRQMKREFKMKSPVLRLYDRPTADFKPLDAEQRMEFLMDMELSESMQMALQKGKLKVLVSSTSWTPDEDFSILLDALVGYSQLATSTHPQLPELLVVITGKGPQKDLYLKKITHLEKGDALEMVTIKTAWLPTYAYASLLASADVGISLHTSSSGVDLPMKVVDMFGAGLPVVGWSMFESWPELVKEGVNGRGFGSMDELRDILVQLLGDDGERLRKLKRGVLEESKHRWDDEWTSVAGKALAYVAS